MPRKQEELTLDQLIECRNKVLTNAMSLLEDSKCLIGAGRYQRAFTLAHLASEEIAKMGFLIDPILRTIYGEPIQWEQFWIRFRSHSAKLLENAVADYWQLPLRDTFGKHILEFTHKAPTRNVRKNMSLYVSFKDGRFVEPSEVITKGDAEAEYAQAVERLRYSVKGELDTEFLVSEFRKDPSQFQRPKGRKGKA